MAPQTFRDFIPADVDLDAGVVAVLESLERNGWYPHGRIGAAGIRYWPDFARGRQIAVPYGSPIAEQQLAFFAQHTGIDELLKVRERE